MPAKCLSAVSVNLRAALPEELDPYHTIDCYDQLTNKVVPMHPSKIGCTASDNDTELNGSTNEAPVIASSTFPLLNLSTGQVPAGVDTSMKPQADKSLQQVPVQPITLTHKYQENKHSKKHSEPSGSRSHSNSPSSGNSSSDESVLGIPLSGKSVSATTGITTPSGTSPLATHPMLNAIEAACGLPTIPQPFPMMFNPTTFTTNGAHLPFMYPSMPPFGIGSPLQQFPIVQQGNPNQFMMVGCPTFMWPPSSNVTTTGFNFMMPNSSVSQTPPSSSLQENSQTRKRCTPPPVVDRSSQVTSTVPEPSPKRARPDTESTSSNSQLPTLSSATISNLPVATIARHSNIPSKEMNASHKPITNDGSSSESEMKDIDDSESEDDMVTCSQPAPIEGTNNLPPCKLNENFVALLWCLKFFVVYVLLAV